MSDKNYSINIKLGRAKNFFSIGNAFMEFDYSLYDTTLIVGKNGSGKSSCGPDLITYALFGKPYRDIKLAQLINTVNNKAMVVELEFSVLGVDYVVKRGQKPALFEIYKNGDLITQDAATKDYQKVLEEQILKMNLKAFKQYIVIGSASYTPFMELKAAERRQVIEDILDISIFTKMGEISRATERTCKSELGRIDAELKIRRETLTSTKENLRVLIDDKAKIDSSRDQKIAELEATLKHDKDMLGILVVDMKELKSKTDDFDKMECGINALTSTISKYESNLEQIKKQVSNIEKDIFCHSCSQMIPEDTRKESVKKLSEPVGDIKAKLKESVSIKNSLVTKVEGLKSFVARLNDLTTETRVLAAEISSINSQILALNTTNEMSDSIDALNKTIEESTKTIVQLSDDYAKAGDDFQYYNLVSSMLKDSGIKATIVSNYLPIINKLINEYLEEFGLFVGFELSSTFEETLKARHRDTYSYNSFSEGEKAMISCAILYTWRHISAIRNVMSCNLLFLDEVGGSSLDVDAHKVLVETVKKTASNIFLITHRETDEDMFSRVWEFSKPKNFTILEERFN